MNRKFYFLLVFACSFSCFAEDYSYTKFDFNPTITFAKKQNNITLKLKKTSGAFYSNEQSRHFTYIIEINEKIESAYAVYLSLLDSDGFQIRDKIFIANICADFQGQLKGNFIVTLSENEKICGAELYYYGS